MTTPTKTMAEAAKKRRDELANKWWVAGDKHSDISFKQGFDAGYAYQEEKLRVAVEALEIMSKGEGSHDPSKICMNRMAKECLSQILGEYK